MPPENPITLAPQRRSLPHATPPWVHADAVFFITACCRERSGNHLCLPPVAAAVFESVSFRIQRGDWFVHLLVLMPDHLHALISFPHDREMKTVIAQWKEILAKRAGIPWQRDFFDHRLRTQESYEEKAGYIHMNPARKGLAPAPEQWPWVWEPEAGQRTITAPAK